MIDGRMSSRGLALALLSLAGLAAQAPQVEVLGVTEAPGELSAHLFADLDGDGRAELVTVAPDGTVDVLALGADGVLQPRAGAPLRLPRPAASLLGLDEVVGGPGLDLLVLSDAGVHAYPLAPGGRFAAEPVELSGSGRLGFRVGAPRFAEFLRDVNADGALDLIVPRRGDCELWLRSGSADGPRFDLVQTLEIDFEHSMWARTDALSTPMRNRIRVPQLDIRDVNGDGRPDLLVEDGQRRRFHLQREDGRFAERGVEVDLTIFRDTTPRASVELGQTIVLSDRQQYQSGDLNGDGIPDHVIAHRRKVWSFLASADGPQFTKPSTRMVAEDISGLLLMHLDEDERKDLLIFKVDAPSVGDLALGLVASIDVPITVLGYRTDENGDFEARAGRRRELTLRAPSLVRLLADADDLVKRFLEVVSKFRWSTLGDLDGDGRQDLALIAEDGLSVELWRGAEVVGRSDRSTERWLRELLFENPDPIFDVDRLFELVAQVFDTRTSALTGRRAADARGAIPARPGRYFREFQTADLDGDGRAEMVIVDDGEAAPGRLAFVVMRWTALD
jgi:hypothetical protein